MRTKHTDWLKSQPYAKEISPLGESVAEVLGTVFSGLYHLSDTSLKKANWANSHFLEIVIRGSLSSWDSSLLTWLVVLAHDAMLRLDIEGAANGYLRLRFHRRETRWEPGINSSMSAIPTMETHLTHIRKYHPAPAEQESLTHANSNDS